MAYKYTPQQLKEKYKRLPKDVQKAYFGEETAEIIQKIGQENKLNVRQVGVLADEAGLLMLGINPPGDFVKNLSKRLDGVDKETVQKIAQEINTRIFAKIRESLRKVHGISEDKKGEKGETGEKKGLPSDLSAKASASAEASAKEGPSPEALEGDGEPMSHIIKPRTAPFVVSQKKPKMEGTAPILPKQNRESSISQPNQNDLEEIGKKEEEPVESKSAVKDMVKERKNEEGFRSKPSFTEVKLPEEKEQGKKEGKKKEPPKKPTYKGGADPYREPVD